MSVIDLALGQSGPLREDYATPSGQASRIVDAALACVARWGLAKTTLDDIAREAGCARATVYRLFPGGRDALWDAVVATEAERFLARLSARASAESGLEDVVVALIAEAATALSSHAALSFLVSHEPEAILPHLAFHHMDGVLRNIAAATAPLLRPWLIPSIDGTAAEETAARAAEWVARIVLSYWSSPAAEVDLTNPEAARRLVRQFVLPGLVPAKSKGSQ